ncbi:heterokaryon incompatibility protein-domain-containing protein [Phyllosticta citribraziliensis]
MRLTSLPPRSKGKSPVNRKKSSAASSSGSSSDDDLDSDAEGSLFEPYVALSYVWGSKEDQQGFEKLLTNLNNVLTRGFRHAIEEDLKGMPKVIQSSVDLVRRLGYRYLWIDSICIVQDSNRSWRWNSQVMDRIYSNAEFTICAADGSNAKAGLVAFDSPEASSEQVIERCAPGVRLMISRDVESQIASSAWNSRAWTFQERLLSRRCLIFTQGRVFFQCRKATFSEDIVASPQASQVSAWSLDLVRSPLVLLNKLEERPVWFYMHCVELFSGRCLTKSTDVLAAFNGVSNLIESAMTGPLCFGLPTSHFDLALLWTPQKALKRRVGGDFPSWSWCGWEGGSASYFSHDFIQDCLENVHQWLISHTWIQWHIRDSQSKLRPLWLTCERVLKDQELRWKGYDSFERSKENMEKGIHEIKRKLDIFKEQKEGPNMRPFDDQRFDVYYYVEGSESGSIDSRTPPPEVRAKTTYYSSRPPEGKQSAAQDYQRTTSHRYQDQDVQTQSHPRYQDYWRGFGDYAYEPYYDREYQEDKNEHRRTHSPIQREQREGPRFPSSPSPPPPPRRRGQEVRFRSRIGEDMVDSRRRPSPVYLRPAPPRRSNGHGDLRQRADDEWGDEWDYEYDDVGRSRSRNLEDKNDYHRRPRASSPLRYVEREVSPPSPRLRRRAPLEVLEDEEEPRVRSGPRRRRRSEPKLDPYGRRPLEGRRGKQPEFRKRAPESPFAVYGADFSNLYKSEPDSPMLQFWTDSVWLYLIEPSDHNADADPDGGGGESSASKGCGPGLRRYGIADAAGDWCGSIILSEQWARENMHRPRNGGDPAFQFLALSRAKKFTKDECGTWSFYVPLDRQQSEWDLSYVMLVEVQSSVHYRVGVGKVFRHAFRNGAKGKARWEEIVLG